MTNGMSYLMMSITDRVFNGLTSGFVDQRKRMPMHSSVILFNPMLLQNQNTKSQQHVAILGLTLKDMFGNALLNNVHKKLKKTSHIKFLLYSLQFRICFFKSPNFVYY